MCPPYTVVVHRPLPPSAPPSLPLHPLPSPFPIPWTIPIPSPSSFSHPICLLILDNTTSLLVTVVVVVIICFFVFFLLFFLLCSWDVSPIFTHFFSTRGPFSHKIVFHPAPSSCHTPFAGMMHAGYVCVSLSHIGVT